jgi:glycosyltransferase involved in cell wall biosynthesis
MSKKKVLVLSDHALSTSGVGTQTRHLIMGLLEKNNDWSFRQFGAALKHNDYRTVVVNDDFIIKPIDGFGDRETLRVTLATEKPDVVLIFTDPRFFIWLFEMEDEIHQVCPIAWWHVWDNKPFPEYNKTLYESTDAINCHSYLTYEMLKERFPNKTKFIPHSIPDNVFHPLSENERLTFKKQILGENRSDHFVGIWVNRNAKRKRPNDVLLSWKLFLDNLEKEKGHRNATLILHTDPTDNEGPNLLVTAEMLGIQDTIFFSRDRLEFDKMNILYNISDFCLNISYAEGFGLSTLECMQAGKPIIAIKTGGLTRQVVDHRDGTENGVALDVTCKTLVGSQQVPYIYEDYVSCEEVASAIFRLSDMSKDSYTELCNKVKNYVSSEFAYKTTIDLWDESLKDLCENWRENYERWNCKTF